MLAGTELKWGLAGRIEGSWRLSGFHLERESGVTRTSEGSGSFVSLKELSLVSTSDSDFP